MKKIDLNMNKIVFVISEKDKKLIGTLSDGDIRRYLLRKGNINDKIFMACNKKPLFVKEENFEKDLEEVKKKKPNVLIPLINK